MMPGLLGSLTFTAPWILVGLAVLPIIWWLLRLTPPRPEFGHLSADLAPSWAQGARKNADTKPMVAYGPSYAGRRRGDRRIGRSFH